MAKRVLITGCSTGGVGHALAQQLAGKGYDVVATVRKRDKAGDLNKTDNVKVIELDVRNDASVKAALEESGDVDVLVNNAAFEVWGPVEEMTVDDFKDQYETNVFGPLRMIIGLAPQMRNRGSGVIVNVSSVAGTTGAPLNGAYSSSKWALEAITETLHFELGHFGIRTHLIEPGGIDTPFGSNQRRVGAGLGKESPYTPLVEEWSTVSERLGAGGASTAADVAKVIVDAIETGDKLRYIVGNDANMVTTARKA
jgi:NAD(P)-dependent dehydrogenase (short-subunit alcohol dehydrogenase family)